MRLNSYMIDIGVKGNSVTRAAKACRKEILTNAGIIATSLPAFAAGIYYNMHLISGIFGTSIGISVYDTKKAVDLYSEIKPDFSEIKKELSLFIKNNIFSNKQKRNDY